MTCPIPGDLIERNIDRVLTQYRESPKLLQLIRSMLVQVEHVLFSICDLPSFFEIDTAVGDQLTLVGKRLGWPRCHCVCTIQPVFGFACEGVPQPIPIVGFCDDNSTWLACDPFGIGEICLSDDEIYRAFLRARRYQILSFYDIESLTDAIQTIWGESALVLDAGHGRVVIAPGRDLTATETALLQLVPRVLPVAPGIRVRFYFGANVSVFGFGDGWGGFCDLADEGDLPAVDDSGNVFLDDDDAVLVFEGTTQSAPWMCEIDVRPYGCPDGV